MAFNGNASRILTGYGLSKTYVWGQHILGLTLALLSLTSVVRAQNITIDVDQKPLSSVLDQITKEHDVHFSYSSEVISPIKVTLSAKDMALEDFLSQVLQPYGLEAERNKDNFYYIRKAKRRLIFMVSDEDDLTAVPYAALRIKDTYKGGYSDESGIAEIALHPDSDTVILLRSVGYEEMAINIEALMDDTIRINLKKQNLNLFEFEVIEYLNKAILLQGDISYVMLKPEDMEVLPGLPEADVLLSVQMLPGIESNDETASGLNIRGGGQDEGLIYWDRIPVYQPAHYFGTVTSFIPAAVEDITVYKNYIPSQYTGATSGLLNIEVFDSIPDQLKVSNSTTFTHSDLLINAPIGNKMGLIVGGRASYNHLVETPAFNMYSNKLFDGSRQEDILNADDDDENQAIDLQLESQLKFWDMNAKLILPITEKDYISISGIMNTDDLNFTALNVEDSSRTDQTHAVAFSGANFLYDRKWSKDWGSSLSLSYSDYEMNHMYTLQITDDDEVTNDRISVDNKLKNIEMKAMMRYDGMKDAQVRFGYQLNNYSNNVLYEEAYTFEEALSDTLEASSFAHGVHLAVDKKINDKWILRPQIRLDYYQISDGLFVNPVFNMQYKISDGWWTKLSYGQYAQALRSLNELEINVSNVSERIWLLADNEELGVLQSKQATIGGLYNKKGWLIDFDFYYKETSGLSALNQVSDNIGADLDFATGKAETKGVDVMIKKKFKRYHSWLSYAWSESIHTFPELQSNSFYSSLDRPHQFRWAHSVNLNQWEVSLGWIFKTGTPVSAPTGIAQDPEDDENYFMTYSSLNQTRLPNYHRLDFSIWYNFPAKAKKVHGTIGFSLLNVYDRDNTWRRFYYLEDLNDDDIPELVEEERNYLGLTPNITVRLGFN